MFATFFALIRENCCNLSGARSALQFLLLLLIAAPLLVTTNINDLIAQSRQAVQSRSAKIDACPAFKGVHDFDALITTPRPSVDCVSLGLRDRSLGRALLIDAFMLAYEPPMILLLRILETIESVDAILILESDSTFTGLPRNLTWPSLEPCLARWSEKIFFSVLRRRDVPLDIFSSYLPKDQPMLVERFQRDAIATEAVSVLHELRNRGSREGEIFLGISDLDEVPRPEMLSTVAQCEGFLEPASFRFDAFMYSFRWAIDVKIIQRGLGPVLVRFDEQTGKLRPWAGGEIMAPGDGRWAGNTPAVARGLPQEDRFLHAAWHLSYFLTPEAIQLKLASFAHTEYNLDPKFKNLTWIKDAIRSGHNFLDGSQLKQHECHLESGNTPAAAYFNAAFEAFACPD